MKTIMLLCVAAVCTVQASDSQTITNWGESVQGVQLSITIATNVFPVGSSATVESIIKNSSTNDISLLMSAVNFNVLLTNNTGKSNNLIKPVVILYPRRFVTIKPGEESDESIPVTFGDAVEPGDYTLEATRHFTMNGKDFELVSNLLKVQVK